MRRNRSGVSLYSLLTIVCLLLFFALGTAACGNNPVNASPTATATTVVVPKSCGTISHLGVGPAKSTGKSTPQSVASCFWQAYQTCTATSVIVVTSSIDTSVTRTFQIQKIRGTCSILDTVQSRVLPRPPHVIGTYTCATANKQPTALQFQSCQGDGTITVSLS